LFEKLVEERRPLDERYADIVIGTTGKTPDQVVTEGAALFPPISEKRSG